MTKLEIKACLRLGVEVYLQSSKTKRVWQLENHEGLGKIIGYQISPGLHSSLTTRQIDWHLENKPTNFTTINPCASGSITTSR